MINIKIEFGAANIYAPMQLINLNHSAKLANLPFDLQYIVNSHLYDIVMDELASNVYEFRKSNELNNKFELGIDRYVVSSPSTGEVVTTVHWPGSKSVTRFNVKFLNEMFRRCPNYLTKVHLYG